MADLGSLTVDIGLDVSKLTSGVASAESQLKRLTAPAERAAATLGRTGRRLTAAITLPAVAAGVFAVKSFADFDSAMTQSTAIMGDVSDVLRNDLAAAAREMALQSTFSAKEAADAYFFLASAGFDAEQSIAALPAVTRFAQAGMFDLALATDLATDAQSALGLKVEDPIKNLESLTRVTDVLVKANTLANATVEQFSTSLTRKAGAAAKIVGKDIEEVVAVLAAFADQGVKGELAGNALNIVFRDLQTRAIENEEAFKKAGIAVFDSAGEFNNVADVIQDLEIHLDGMSDAQKKSTLLQLGFQDRSVAFIQTLLGTSEAIREYEAELRNAGGTTQEVADKQLKSFTAQMIIFKNTITDVAIDIGEILAPSVRRITRFIGNLVLQFQGLDERSQKAIIVMVGIAAAIGPVLIALAGLVAILPFVVAGFSALATAIPIVAALGLVIAAVSVLFINLAGEGETFADRSTDSLQEVKDFAVETFQTLVELPELLLIQLKFMKTAGEIVFLGFFENLFTIAFVNISSIGRVIGILADEFGSVFDLIIKANKNFLKSFATNFGETFSAIIGLAIEFSKSIGTLFSRIPDLITGDISIEDFVSTLETGGFADAINKLFDVVDPFAGLENDVIRIADKLEAAITPEFELRDLGQELADAIKTRDDALEKAMNINTEEQRDSNIVTKDVTSSIVDFGEQVAQPAPIELEPTKSFSAAIEAGSAGAFKIAAGLSPEDENKKIQKDQLDVQKKNLKANEKQAQGNQAQTDAIKQLAAALQVKGIT